MFGFGILKKTASPRGERSRLVGVELSATSARAVVAGDGRTRSLCLDADRHELPLFVALDRRTAAVGEEGYALARKAPHSVCSNFLPLLGKPQQWRGPRLSVSPEAALQVTLDKLQPPIVAESDAAGLCLPSYLTATQVLKVNELAGIAKLPLRGTVSAPLAVAAHRAAFVLTPRAVQDLDEEDDQPSVLPLRSSDADSGAVLIIDVDEYALTAALLVVSPSEISVQSVGAWPRASLKSWHDRLIDALSDRCVRLCRRDPRDSADAEQALYEQLPDLMDECRLGRPVRLSVRAAHWYQDIQLQPDEVEACTGPVLAVALDGLRQFLQSSAVSVPPRAVWLSHSAGRLPGLAAKVYKHSPEHSTVSILPPTAFAEAAAALVPRWLVGSLPRGHLDGRIPLERVGSSESISQAPSATIGKTARK